tara:strand:- start:861 stop:1313 length:453 start_codon:yes stop_codon:yes gene_type:complete
MATTVTKTTLSVQILEDITLNGTKHGSKTIHEFQQIAQVDERILSIPTYEVSVLNLSSSDGAGTYNTDKIRYVRLTNLDNKNFLRLEFASGSAGSQFDVKLNPNTSYIFTNASVSGSSAGVTFGSFSDITTVKAKADTSTIDLGLFVATT